MIKKEFIRKSTLDKFFFFSPNFISIRYAIIRVVDLLLLKRVRTVLQESLKIFICKLSNHLRERKK